MERRIKIIFMILGILFSSLSMSNLTYAAGYDATTVYGAVKQGESSNNHLRSFVVPAVSYSRKYAIRLLSTTKNSTKKAITLMVDSKDRAVYTLAAIRGGTEDTGTGILGRDGTSILAISGYNQSIATYSGHLFTTKYSGTMSWINNNVGSTSIATYWGNMVNKGTYAYQNGLNVTYGDFKDFTGYTWASIDHRVGIIMYFDEESPSINFSYNNDTNVLTATATDRTTDPVPAAGVKYYGWANGSTSQTITPILSTSQTKTISSSGTVYFTARDAYENQNSISTTFYQKTFKYNYTGAPADVVDYKWKNNSIPYPSAPERLGYDFMGWSTNASATSGTKSGNITTNSNETYYAIWKINNSLSTATVTISPITYLYDGNAKEPSVTVNFLGATLTKDVDYTVTYLNNVNVGTATVKVTGIGKYTGENNQTFTITSRTISDGTLTLSPNTYTYNGGQNKPTPNLVVNGKTLVLNTDYTVSYTNNINAGTATATVTGKGNYKDTMNTSFTINKKSVEVQWENTTVTYNATPLLPTANAPTGVAGETIVLNLESPQTNQGTYNVTASIVSVSGGQGIKENYTLTNTTTQFTINKRTVSDGIIEVNPKEYIYDGNEKKPTATLVVNGRTLVNGSEYTVSYSNNIDAGTGNILLTGIGNYTGTINDLFTIKEKELIVKWENTNFMYNQSEQAPTASTTTGVDSEEMELIVTGGQIDTGTYEAVALMNKVNGGRGKTENYKLLNDKVNFTIEKANRNLIAPDVTVEYDGAEHKIVATQIGDGIIQYSSNNSLIDAGSEIVKVWIEETRNWLGAETTANLTVTKQIVNVTWGNTSIPYTGELQKPTVEAIAKGPNGVEIQAELVVKGEKSEVGGPYIATVSPVNPNYTLEPNKTEFYIVPNANVILSGTLEETIFIYEGDEKKPKATVLVNGVPELQGVELVEGKDYIIEYKNNIEPSTEAIAKIIGIGNYDGITLELKFTIEKLERKSIVNMKDYYFGTELPSPSITDSEEAENIIYYYQTVDSNIGGTVWNVSDAESLPIGIYYIYAYIPETAHYKEKLTEPTRFRVIIGVPIDPTVENKTYNGMEQVGVSGEIGIILSGTTAATEVGTYTAYGEIAPNYEWPNGFIGSKEYVWKIYPCDVNKTEITLNPIEYNYDGSAHEPTVTVTFNGKVLVEGKDYTVSYKNNINAGRADAVITGMNNFSGEAIAHFTINPIELDRVSLEKYYHLYTGEKIKLITIVHGKDNKLLTENKDYVVTYYDNIEIGTATVQIIGIGNYFGELETSFSIQGNDITKANVKLLGLPYIYDGSEKCPDAEVVFEGTTLVEGRDYKIVYENNINAGEKTAIANIVGIGEYAGTIKISFTILKADRDAKILPGKALILGTQGEIPYYYKGEDSPTTLVINDTTIISATEKEYTHEGSVEVTALKVGKSTFALTVAESQNYRELVLKSEVTVFEKAEDTYPIYGWVVINDNDEYTNNPRTMLTLNVDFGDYMYISESKEVPEIDNPDWHEFSKKMPYEFNAAEGEKTIYVWFKDKNGTISQMATDSIILDYDASVPAVDNNIMASDNVLLDETQLDRSAPDIKFAEYHNKTVDIEVIRKQEDVMVNGVRSGVDYATVKYGYREAGEGMPNDTYIWQDTSVIVGLKYDKDYAFVTQGYDRAGNGVTISEETLIHTEMKYKTEVEFNDTNKQYNGLIQEIEKATFKLANDTPITGTIIYTYYVDKDCTTKTTPLRDGSLADGGAPSNPGIYYVTVELKGDKVYYDVPDDGEKTPMAELRIGWDISKTTDDEIFAYPERTDIDSEEYILNVIGNGEMADLSALLVTDKAENEIYWLDYKDKIIKLKIANDGENQIETIGAEIFNHLVNIKEIEIPNTIVKIGDYAFEGCSGVNQTIIIPTSVIEIGANPFVNVNTSAFETEFAHRVFETIDGVLVDIEHKKLIAYPNGKTDEKYTIPNTIKIIKENAFSGSDNLKDIVIPNGVESIETRAFYDCPNLEIIEVEDLMDKSDDVINLKEIETEAFSNIKNGAIVYTFSKNIADKFENDRTHVENDTKIYYPPTFILHPINMNGAVGRQVKFIVETEAGYPEETKYQWFKVKDDVTTIIDGATNERCTTEVLTEDNHQEHYYARAYNAQYYYDRGYVNSNEAILTMIENANYIVERGTYNNYIFETLQEAFDFAINDDVVKPLQNVANEGKAILKDNKSIIFNIEGYTIHLDETIEVEDDSKLELVGTAVGAITKDGGYIFDNRGSINLNGLFTLSNPNGFGIKSMEKSNLVFTNGNIIVDRNAIYAENSTVMINGATANITAKTSEATATAISIQENTIFEMINGNVTISYNAEPTVGSIYGIYVDCVAAASINISGGNITATSTNKLADAIANAGKSDIIIRNDTTVTGSRSGIRLLDSDLYGEVIVEAGTIIGGDYGILNQAQSAKIIIGKEGNGVSVSSPIVVGETLAIFNTKEKDTLEFYDGILYSNGANIIYEDLDNTTLVLSPERDNLIDTAQGRNTIITENGYSFYTELSANYNGKTYKAAYLKENRYPTVSGPDDQIVKVGEQGVFEVIAKDGHPDVYEYQWQVSTDYGKTWTSVTVGIGGNTSRYTTPIVTETMNGYMYRCVVTNARGNVISKEVSLIVLDADDGLNQRPVGRIVFTNGRIVETEGDKKVVNMQLIVKTTAELASLKLNGKEIFGTESYTFDDKSIIVTKASNSPIEIVKGNAIGGNGDSISTIVEYTYTYNLKVYKNGILTVDIMDVEDRDNTVTQTVDLLHDLKIEYYVSKLTQTNNHLTITFYADRPVKPISSVSNSYMNSKYLDLDSLDGTEYSYRFKLDLMEALPTTIFYFEDAEKNEGFVEVEEITRVRYNQVKFNDGMIMIDDLTVLDAYEMAQDLENVVEVNKNEEVQNRYGLNGVQSDLFMSRARDIGAIDLLNSATTVKSYDGIFTDDIKSTISDNNSIYGYISTSDNIFVAAAAKGTNENEFTKENRKYVDIISKTISLYKGMDLSTFNIEPSVADAAPYMYTNIYGPTNISATTVANAAFRATIVGK